MPSYQVLTVVTGMLDTTLKAKRLLFIHGFFAHELAHLLMCKRFNVYVSNRSWSLFDGNEVVYESVQEARHVSWISYAPLLLNLPLGMVLFGLLLSVSVSTVVGVLSAWLIGGLLVTSVPSRMDAEMLLNAHDETTLLTAVTDSLLLLFEYWYIGIDVLVVALLVGVTVL